MMARAPGVGPKLAARLVLEMKDKALARGGAEYGGDAAVENTAGPTKAAEDAILAFIGLGYARPRRPRRPPGMLGSRAEAQTSSLVRAGLKELAQ